MTEAQIRNGNDSSDESSAGSNDSSSSSSGDASTDDDDDDEEQVRSTQIKGSEKIDTRTNKRAARNLEDLRASDGYRRPQRQQSAMRPVNAAESVDYSRHEKLVIHGYY